MKRLLPPLLLALVVLASVSGYFLYRTRGEVEVLAERSLPGVRLLGDLRDLVSRVQIGLLEERSLHSAATPGPADERLAQLDEAARLLERYGATVVSERGRELTERVAGSLADYRAGVEALLATASHDAAEAERVRGCMDAYRRLHLDLAALREERFGRIEDRISKVNSDTRRGWATNLIALGVLAIGVLVSWLGVKHIAHDAHDY